MSRCVSLNHARANASANWAGFSKKRLEIFSYAGSSRSDRSVVSIAGAWRLARSWASGIVPAPAPPFARAEGAPPAEALLLEAGRFAIRPPIGLRAGAVSRAEGVTTRDELHRLLVVHRH